ncbi:transglutaminase domain-containing protein [bacterium]|nr:transglutaminase domain-containing protein [bacterium]
MKKGRILTVSMNILIVISWVAMMFLLIKREGFLREKGVEANFRNLIPQDLEVDTWKSIFVGGQWAGYMHTSIGPYAYKKREGKGYLVKADSFLRFTMFGQPKDIRFNSVQMLDGTFRLLKFEAMISGMAGINLTGKRIGDHLLVEVMQDKTRYKRIFEAADDLFLENSILSIYRGRGLKVGDSYELHIFNPLTLTAEPTTVEVTGMEDNYLVLETRFGGLVSRSWIDDKGRVVREETANGWLMRVDTKERIDQYMVEDTGKRADMLSDFAVKTNRGISNNPRSVGFMRIRISGVDLDDFNFDGKRQRVADQGEGILEIQAVFPDKDAAMSLPYEGKEYSLFLDASMWVQSDDPEIRSMAIDIIGKETNIWLAATRIGEWVNKNIEKTFCAGIPVATSVLLHRQGDCNEHATLFVALARSCGIPADICAGLVFLEDGFYYHAWPKVYVGEWVHLDPTFGQPVADATHIELVSGDLSSQARLAMTLGKIKIEVLEASVSRDFVDRD